MYRLQSESDKQIVNSCWGLNFRRRANRKREADQALFGSHNRRRCRRPDDTGGGLQSWDWSGGRCGVRRNANRARCRLSTIRMMMHSKCNCRSEDQQKAQPRNPFRDRPHSIHPGTRVESLIPQMADGSFLQRPHTYSDGCAAHTVRCATLCLLQIGNPNWKRVAMPHAGMGGDSAMPFEPVLSSTYVCPCRRQ